MSFARTKIQPPRPRGAALLARPRIDEPLADALATQRLVLLSAAAGYGKTAAMSRQIERWPAGHALAWISADAGDDLPRLLECLVAALEPYDLPWRAAPESLVAAAVDPEARTRVAAALINTLEASDVPHGVIVFDDLHRVDDAAWFAFLDVVIERLGPRWTIVLVARHDPPLALARWRVAGELAEFRQDALRFTRDELAQWIAARGGEATRLDELLARTDGWAAGMQLALRGGGASAGTERMLLQFLESEVIDGLDAELRDFLLDTSVLPELTASRAAAVTGRVDAARLLARVEQLGLFVHPLEGAEPTLKLHDLMRAALEQRLAVERPQALPGLWRRAAAGETDPVRRMTMLLRGGDAEGAAQVLLAAVPVWVTAGAIGTAGVAMKLFDGHPRDELPAWQLARALHGWSVGDFGAMDDAARKAQAVAEAHGDAETADAALGYRAIALNFMSRRGLRELGVDRIRARSPVPHVLAGVAMAWADIDEGRFDEARQHYTTTLAHLERSDEPHLWYQGNLGTVGLHIPGMGPLIDRWVDGALRVCGDQPLTLRAAAWSTRGWHRLLVAGDVMAAEEALRTAEHELRWQAETIGTRGPTTVLAMQIAAARGDATAFRDVVGRFLGGTDTGWGHRARWIAAIFVTGGAAAVSDAMLLREQLDVFERTVEENAMPELHGVAIEHVHGHLAWLAGDAEAAVRHWRAVLADAVVAVRMRQHATLPLFHAAACLALDRPREAAAALAGLHRRAQQGGAGSMLLARPVAPRLLAADWQGLLDDDDRRALESWGRRLAATAAGAPGPVGAPEGPAAAMPAASADARGAPAAGLSSREVEVLERIAAGDSNKLIARVFDLSPHTVKRHVANILDKLGAQSRGQAAAWYREHA